MPTAKQDTLKQIPSETSKPKSSCTSTGSPSNTTDPPGTANTAELYWGSVVKDKLLCPVFVRLLAAIFNHYDKTVYPAFTGWMEPSKFCAVWLGAGYSALDMPILTYAAHPTPSASDMYELDQNLTVLFQSLRVEHKMATREPPMIPFPKPFGDGLRSGPVPNGMPLLPRRGFEQYILFQILVDPTETSLRLNHLLALLPPLIDSETKQPFKYRHIPRSCFPPLLDPGAEELRRCIEKQRRGMQAWKEARDAENAWRPPMPGDNIYNRTKSPDFMHMTGVGRWAGRFQGGY